MSKSYLIDMDGVIVRGSELIPGADAFLDRLRQRSIKFLILTNNPLYTQRDLQHRLQRIGIAVTDEHLYTAALATGADPESAARLANYAGGIVVMKRGTATVSQKELLAAIDRAAESAR